MKLLKICLFGNPNSAHTLRLACQLFEHGYAVTLCCQESPKTPLPQGIVICAPQKRYNLPRLRYPLWAAWFRQKIKEIQPDIVHAVGASGAAWLAAATGFHPLVITATGSDLLLLGKASPAFRLLTRQAVRQADQLLCVSPALQSAAIAMGKNPEQVVVNFFGVNLDVFYPPAARPPTPQRAGGCPRLVVLSLRAINTIYNPLDIARAFGLARDKALGLELWVMTYNADPNVLAEFRKEIDKNSCQEAVRYLPPLQNDTEIARVMRQSEIAISVASSDGTPVSVLEAMACGCAVVLGDIPALQGWAVHEQNALLVPLHHPDALSQAILRLVDDIPLRHRLGEVAALTARSKASSEGQFRQLAQVYNQLIEAKQ
jgi:glycosyltransferase involved in cell wall biosynthesis